MIDAERIRQATREVLGRPAYDELEQSLAERWFETARTTLADWLDTLLGSAAANGLGRVIALVVVVVVVAGAVVLLLGLRRRGEVEAVVELDPGLDAAGALAAADVARAGGDLVAATRARYGALVLTLVEAGVLAGRPGLTVGEVDLAVTAGVPTAASACRAAGRVLADVVYGDEPATADGDDVVAAGLAAVARATGRADLRPRTVTAGGGS